ncbi:IS66 family insertion sequence element accessory protein TnpB [Acidovorax sp. A1169]|uniref:IS66 family insertion sequence element accessory protein TnpB n=1 Tax=Acidovorax sp. A1169 TaxID=3059524 RepID=UPI002737846C|nr:IS66 family insertion sequence element accessory protein TnpB [Acidovorax sp. A1169]MDP4076396.1 IS66 family insertion sequence element accessory protein TnpB [Acidovorax sp. A1169]
MKLLVNDGFGVWYATRRLHEGSFLRTTLATDRGIALTRQQFDTLVVGLLWARLQEMQRIAYV